MGLEAEAGRAGESVPLRATAPMMGALFAAGVLGPGTTAIRTAMLQPAGTDGVAAALAPGMNPAVGGPAAQQRLAGIDACGLLANGSVAVPVPHEGVCRMPAADRGDPVAARFLAGDPAVAVVVPTPKGVP